MSYSVSTWNWSRSASCAAVSTRSRCSSLSRVSSYDPPEDLSLEDYFQRFVLEHQDSMSETELAQKLGVSRKCLWERRQRFGIPRKKGAGKRQSRAKAAKSG